MIKRAVVIAVHPDDETLGAGGTLLRLKDQGVDIHWLILTDIEALGLPSATRQKEIRIVEKMYGFNSVHCTGFAPSMLDTLPLVELVHAISGVVNEIQPDTLFVPFSEDVHSDHRVAFEATMPCMKSFRFPFIKRTMMMETLSETDFAPPYWGQPFAPNFLVDISAYLDAKISIFEQYASECGEHPYPRSAKNIKAQATMRGTLAGCEAAEAFMLLREIW